MIIWRNGGERRRTKNTSHPNASVRLMNIYRVSIGNRVANESVNVKSVSVPCQESRVL